MPHIDIDHRGTALQAWRVLSTPFISLRQRNRLAVWLLFRPVIEYQVTGHGQLHPPASIDVQSPRVHIPLVDLRQVKQSSQRHIGVERTLRLIQIHKTVNQKRQIVFDPHVNGIFNGGKLQFLRILIGGSVHCVVKAQQRCLVTEQHPEQAVLILPVHASCFCPSVWSVLSVSLLSCCFFHIRLLSLTRNASVVPNRSSRYAKAVYPSRKVYQKYPGHTTPGISHFQHF